MRTLAVVQVLLLHGITAATATVEETDKTCNQQESCVTREECPAFLKKFEHWKTLRIQDTRSKKLRQEVQEKICNKKEKAVCCNKKEECTHPVIRPNVNSITSADFSEYNNALKKMKDDKSSTGFEEIGAYHGLPYRCNEDQSDVGYTNGCCIDHWSQSSKRENFVTWHRLYTYNWEKSLAYHSSSKTLALPYWDWTTPPNSPVSLPLLSEKGEWTSGPILDQNKNTHRRFPNVGPHGAPSKQTDFFRGLVKTSFKQTIYAQFNQQIVWPHNWIHVLVGGDMSGTAYASYDPIFFLHHSYVDLLFAYYQELQRLRFNGLSKKSFCKQAQQAKLMPFGNKDFNPYRASQEHSIGYQTLDYEGNFCYKFSELLFDGLTPEQFIKREEKELSRPQILAGVAIKTTGYPSTIIFELTSSSSEALAAGAFHNLGNGKDPNFSAYTDYTLVLYDFTDSLANPSKSTLDTSLKVKVKDVTPSESVYQPVVVFRPAGSYQYIYKIHTDSMLYYGPIMHGLPGSKIQFHDGNGNTPKKNDIHEYIIDTDGSEIRVPIDASHPQEIKYNEHKYHHEPTRTDITFGYNTDAHFKCDASGEPICNPKYFTDGADAVTVVPWNTNSNGEYVTAVQGQQILLLAWCPGQKANVVRATEEEYMNCSIEDLSNTRNGPASYIVDTSTIGTYFFVNGNREQCKKNWKIKIEVKSVTGQLG